MSSPFNIPRSPPRPFVPLSSYSYLPLPSHLSALPHFPPSSYPFSRRIPNVLAPLAPFFSSVVSYFLRQPLLADCRLRPFARTRTMFAFYAVSLFLLFPFRSIILPLRCSASSLRAHLFSQSHLSYFYRPLALHRFTSRCSAADSTKLSPPIERCEGIT